MAAASGKVLPLLAVAAALAAALLYAAPFSKVGPERRRPLGPSSSSSSNPRLLSRV